MAENLGWALFAIMVTLNALLVAVQLRQTRRIARIDRRASEWRYKSVGPMFESMWNARLHKEVGELRERVAVLRVKADGLEECAERVAKIKAEEKVDS